MPPRHHRGVLIVLLVGAAASFLDKFASRVGAAASKLDDLTSRESFTVGELRKIRHDHCKGQIHRARRDDVAAAARTYLPETWPRERSCEPAAIQRWTCGLPAKRRRDTADNTVAKTYRKLLRWQYELTLSTEPTRAVAAGLDGWEWRPRNASCAAEDWLGDDRNACAMRRPTPNDRRIALHARHAALRAAGNRTGWGDGRDGQGATLRWAGSLAPLALASTGKCARRLVDAAIFQRVIGDEYAGKLAVAVHIRRGDACNRWAEPGDGDYADKRPCFRTQHYVDAVVALAERYDKDVAAFVASDSEEAVEEFVSLVPTGRVSVFVQVFDRVRATGKDLPNLGRDTDYTRNFIESRNQRGELDRALTYASIVADLEVLGSCDAIVGTAASWVSRLIFLLIVGNTGGTPPHVFLDQRFGGPADVW